MEAVFILFLVCIFLALIILVAFVVHLSKKLGELAAALRGEEILQRLELHKGELGANLKSLDERLHNVTTEIGGVKEVTAQLQEFQASLKSQKLRGNVGETILGDLLRQILPQERYALQFTFRNGKRVDAVVKTSGGLLVPVDSKFPVEKFQPFATAKGDDERISAWRAFARDVKGYMDETAAYILPEEGTVPFALMYIPFEPIFQEVVAEKELWRYALEKRVYFTSPQTFWATLQFLILGLRREHFAEEAEEVLRTLHAVAKDAEEFEGLLNRAATQLANAKGNMDQLVSNFAGLLGKLEQLHDVKAKSKRGEE